MEGAANTTTTLALLVVSARPAILSFFETIAWRVDHTLRIEHALPEPAALAEKVADVVAPAVAVVDVAPAATRAIGVCQELGRSRPDLPVAGLLCCPFCVTPPAMRALLASGVSALLDLSATARETVRILRAVADGETVLHVRLDAGRRSLLREALTGREPRSELHRHVLELLTRGLPDHEIGKELHLSPHTVKHHLEELRRTIGARNRVELAAWAGRNGFYIDDGRAS